MSAVRIGIVCDLDGLLVDSEGIHFEAYREVLREFGIEINEQLFIEGWLDLKEGVRYGLSHYLHSVGIRDPKEIQAVRDRKSDRFIEIAQDRLEWRPGAEAFLRAVRDRGYPCGVGTGCYRKEYQYMADSIGLLDYVQTMVGGDDTHSNKPDPEIFWEVAKRLDVAPANCVVFENSRLGLVAAERAGMRSVAIPSDWTRNESFDRATFEAEILSESLLNQVETWFKAV